MDTIQVKHKKNGPEKSFIKKRKGLLGGAHLMRTLSYRVRPSDKGRTWPLKDTYVEKKRCDQR